MCVTGKEIADHLLMHEILGVESSLPTGLTIVNGILYIYDDTRLKNLSSFRTTIVAGRSGRAKNVYLGVGDGQPSSSVGIRIPRPSTLTSISAQARGANSWLVHLRKNQSNVDLYTLNIITNGIHDITLNLDLDEGDILQFHCDSTAFLGIRDPLVVVEIAARL